MWTDNETLYDTENFEISLPRSIRFWFLLVVDVPSLICSVIVLYHTLSKKVLRQALHNHVIITLLIGVLTSQMIDIPIYLTFIRLNQVWPQTRSFCFFWWYIDVGVCNSCSILVAWAAIERHILVFHEKWVSTLRKRMLVHYLPLVAVVTYALGFYLLALLIPSCQHDSIDYGLPWCHYSPCYYAIPVLHIWDVVINRLLSSLLIATCSITLLCRVIWLKHYRLQRPVVWRKHRKMTIQLVSVSAAYLLFGFPLFIVQICGLSHVQLNPQIQLWLYFLSFFTVLSLPFVCFASLPSKLIRNTWDTLGYIVPNRPVLSTVSQES